MPAPLITGALIAGGANLLGQGANAFSTGAMNKKSMKFAREMYATSRRDSLADWAMQNEYNSPEQQMKRLKSAGLNPNLVYGNGADAQMGAPIKSSEFMKPQLQAPQFDIGSAVGQFMSTQMTQAQIDNLRASNTLTLEDIAVRKSQQRNLDAQTLKTIADTARAGIDTDQALLNYRKASQLFQTDIDAARANLNKTVQETNVLLNRNEREAAQNASNLQEAAERILNMRVQRMHEQLKAANTVVERQQIYAAIAESKARLENIKKDGTLKQYEIDLNKMNLQKGDALPYRLLQGALGPSPDLVPITPQRRDLMLKNNYRARWQR